jgi:hypothetical protein
MTIAMDGDIVDFESPTIGASAMTALLGTTAW